MVNCLQCVNHFRRWVKIRALRSWYERNGVFQRERDCFVQGDDVMSPCRRDLAVLEGTKAGAILEMGLERVLLSPT